MTTKGFDGTPYQVKVITPEGEAMWASLKSPKQWKNDDKKNFIIEQILTKEEAQPIIDTCNGVIEKVLDVLDKNPKMSPHDPWKIMEDGRVSLKFKRPYFDANDKYPSATPPIPTYVDDEKVDWEKTDWNVGNGSIIQIGGYVRPYYNTMLGLGVSLKLGIVKVTKLVKYEAGDGSDFTELTDTAEVKTEGETTLAGTDF